MRNGLFALVFTSFAWTSTAWAQTPPAAAVRPPVPTDKPSLGQQQQAKPQTYPPSALSEEAAYVPSEACFGEVCGPPSRVWAEADYLLWWIKSGPLPPPILTTGPLTSGGVPNTEGTSVLLGSNAINYEALNGGRFAVGSWLGARGIFGFEAGGFYLSPESSDYTRTSDGSGSPLLVRPLVNAVNGVETPFVVAAPGSFDGRFDFSSSSRLWGFEANTYTNLIRQGQTGLDLLVGFRYLDLSESIDMSTLSTPLPGGIAFFAGNPVLGPSSIAVNDSFATRNQFYGGQIGGRARVQSGRLLLDVTGKVAVGGVHQTARAAGSTTLLNPDGSVAARANGGLLALPSNIGRRFDNDTAFVPEIGVKLGFQVTQRLNANVGYTLIYIDNVARPGDQINRAVNLLQVPTNTTYAPQLGPGLPVLPLNDSRFWAQGLSLGLAYRY